MSELIQQAVNGLGSALGSLGLLLVDVLAWLLLNLIVHPLFSYVIAPLLESTVFHPSSLTGSGVVAKTAGQLWRLTAAVSFAVALFGGAWGAFTMTLGALSQNGRDTRYFVEACVIYAMTLMGGYLFMSTLLGISDVVTTELTQTSFSLAAFAHVKVGLSTSGAGNDVLALLYPLSLIVIAGFLVAAIVGWIMREVDLIVYVGLMPITAALLFTGNRQAFEWNWNEAVGAVLSQMSMALMWYVAFAIMGGSFVPHPTSNGSTFGGEMLRMLLGLGALTMVMRAPQMLQNLTGHRTAGVAGMALGVATGAVMARGARTAASMTPIGQAGRMVVEGKQGDARERVRQWGSPDHKTIGEKAEPVKQSLGKKLEGTAVGKAMQSGAAAVSGSLGKVPGAGAVGGALRTGASMVYQPRATLGRIAMSGLGREGRADYDLETARLSSERSLMGPERAANLHHMSVEDLNRRIDSPGDELYANRSDGSGYRGGPGGGKPPAAPDPEEHRTRTAAEIDASIPRPDDPETDSLLASMPPEGVRGGGEVGFSDPAQGLAPDVARRRSQARSGRRKAGPKDSPPKDRLD